MLRTVILMVALLAVSACGGGRDYSGPGTTWSPGPAASAGGPAAGVAVVRRGDSLYRIARRNGVPLRELITLNRLSPPYRIHPGQKLLLPGEKHHVVRRGDSLERIARRYGVSARRLAAANGIDPPYRIYPGQGLRLPGSGRVVGYRIAKRPAPPPRRAKSGPPRSVSLAPPPPRAGKRFLWPVRGPVALGFGNRGKGVRNDGINILARRGTGVRATENGVVAYSGNAVRGFGNLVLIKHAGGWMSAYAHNDVLLVRTGQKVRRGETISRVGSTGSVSRPQLHFELRRGRRAVDPLRYLGPPRRSISALPADPAAPRSGRPGPV
ncbi:MAG: M23 family metallopeptidase [Defluviicoccus sp.]|nr:M23 family metallopeptidase [Defluviicoccus sp.]MDE0383503.1 M23 family metallopeptidase [Defluviicoccus sp.]